MQVTEILKTWSFDVDHLKSSKITLTGLKGSCVNFLFWLANSKRSKKNFTILEAVRLLWQGQRSTFESGGRGKGA